MGFSQVSNFWLSVARESLELLGVAGRPQQLPQWCSKHTNPNITKQTRISTNSTNSLTGLLDRLHGRFSQTQVTFELETVFVSVARVKSCFRKCLIAIPKCWVKDSNLPVVSDVFGFCVQNVHQDASRSKRERVAAVPSFPTSRRSRQTDPWS